MPLVDGRSIRTVGNTNYARLNDPAVNGLIDQARRPAGERATPGARWPTAVRRRAVYVPLAETRMQLLAGQRLRNGVVMQPYSGLRRRHRRRR